MWKNVLMTDHDHGGVFFYTWKKKASSLANEDKILCSEFMNKNI